MPEMTAADLARIRAAVQFRDGCGKAAKAHYLRVGLRPIDTYARAAFDAMETRIRADERRWMTEALAPLLAEGRFLQEITHAPGCDAAHAGCLAARARDTLGKISEEG